MPRSMALPQLCKVCGRPLHPSRGGRQPTPGAQGTPRVVRAQDAAHAPSGPTRPAPVSIRGANKRRQSSDPPRRKARACSKLMLRPPRVLNIGAGRWWRAAPTPRCPKAGACEHASSLPGTLPTLPCGHGRKVLLKTLGWSTKGLPSFREGLPKACSSFGKGVGALGPTVRAVRGRWEPNQALGSPRMCLEALETSW